MFLRPLDNMQTHDIQLKQVKEPTCMLDYKVQNTTCHLF